MTIHPITDAHPLPYDTLRCRAVIAASVELAAEGAVAHLKTKPAEVWVWDRGSLNYWVYYREEK